MLSDGDGLYFRKQTAEGSAWTLRYRFAGRQRWFTLGNFPDMPLAVPRSEAREARVMLDKGKDPIAARREAEAAQRQRGDVRELAEDWYRVRQRSAPLRPPHLRLRRASPRVDGQPRC